MMTKQNQEKLTPLHIIALSTKSELLLDLLNHPIFKGAFGNEVLLKIIKMKTETENSLLHVIADSNNQKLLNDFLELPVFNENRGKQVLTQLMSIKSTEESALLKIVSTSTTNPFNRLTKNLFHPEKLISQLQQIFKKKSK